jgi:hypothetical protein
MTADARGQGLTPREKEWLALDTELNAQGLVDYIQKRHSEAGQQ